MQKFKEGDLVWVTVPAVVLDFYETKFGWAIDVFLQSLGRQETFRYADENFKIEPREEKSEVRG